MKRIFGYTAWFAGALFMATTGSFVASVDVARADDVQSNLQALAAAATKEGHLTIYDALPAEDMAPVLKAFEAKYPGIAVDYVDAGGATAIIGRIAQESRAGTASADVTPLGKESLAGLEEAVGIKNVLQTVDWPSLGVPDDLIIAYPTAADDVAVKYNSGIWSILYNKDQVSAAPKWDDLLDPKWKGKIGLSKTISLWVILTQKWGEPKVTDFLKKLINDQQARIFGRTSEIVPAVSSGELAMGLIQRHAAIPSINSGAPLGVDPTQDVVVNSGTLIGVPVHAQHPNAAKLYIAWLVSPEAQKIYDEATFRGLPSVPGTWGYENRDKLQVVEWPVGDFDKYNDITDRLSALFPK